VKSADVYAGSNVFNKIVSYIKRRGVIAKTLYIPALRAPFEELSGSSKFLALLKLRPNIC
jgi:hypothetical protein